MKVQREERYILFDWNEQDSLRYFWINECKSVNNQMKQYLEWGVWETKEIINVIILTKLNKINEFSYHNLKNLRWQK